MHSGYRTVKTVPYKTTSLRCPVHIKHASAHIGTSAHRRRCGKGVVRGGRVTDACFLVGTFGGNNASFDNLKHTSANVGARREWSCLKTGQA